jgi:acyl carrier protein
MNENLRKISNILDTVGVYLEKFSGDLKIKDVLLDSLSTISFYLEVENEFGVVIPDEIYTMDLGEYTMTELLEKIIMPLQTCE